MTDETPTQPHNAIPETLPVEGSGGARAEPTFEAQLYRLLNPRLKHLFNELGVDSLLDTPDFVLQQFFVNILASLRNMERGRLSHMVQWEEPQQHDEEADSQNYWSTADRDAYCIPASNVDPVRLYAAEMQELRLIAEKAQRTADATLRALNKAVAKIQVLQSTVDLLKTQQRLEGMRAPAGDKLAEALLGGGVLSLYKGAPSVPMVQELESVQFYVNNTDTDTDSANTPEVPELGAEFFDNPILTRPGESIIERVEEERREEDEQRGED
jgi:hypothetical protein